MDALLQHIPLWDELSHEEREKWLKAAQASPDLAAAAKDWDDFTRRLHDHLMAHIPDGEVLVLHALELEAPESLTPEDREKLSQNRPHLEVAFREIAALPLLINRIRTEIVDFDSEWMAQTIALPANFEAHQAPSVPQNWFSRHPITKWAGGITLAVGLLMLGIWALITVSSYTTNSTADNYATVLPNPYNVETIQNKSTEVQVVELPDGSMVTLYPLSQIQYSRNDFSRRIRVAGKFFFDIQKEEQLFTIESKNAVTTVVGTSFALNTTPSRTEVVLVEGEVMLASRREQAQFVRLVPGEMSRVDGQDTPSVPQKADLGQSLEWTGKFFFRGTTIPDAVLQLEKAYNVRIQIADDLHLETIEGTFSRHEKLGDILDKIALALQRRVTQKSETVFEFK
ncbi:MAG: FecR family protein [Bacteroidetes Order II. Incertae sedis bacterium]|nr:FecR family protein [Bacteroidetes Order II. bacterium]